MGLVLTPYYVSLRFTLILSSHQRLGLRNYLSFKVLTTVIYSPTRAICSANLILFGLIFVLVSGKEYKWSSSWCGLPWLPFTFNDLDSSNSLGAIFSLFVFPRYEKPSLTSIFRTTRKIIIIYILMCTCLDSKRQDKRFRIECLGSLPRIESTLSFFWVTAACRLRFCHIFSAFISCLHVVTFTTFCWQDTNNNLLLDQPSC
jgi:hypothetical protein